jgi:hypothetical protein
MGRVPSQSVVSQSVCTPYSVQEVSVHSCSLPYTLYGTFVGGGGERRHSQPQRRAREIPKARVAQSTKPVQIRAGYGRLQVPGSLLVTCW